VVLSLSFLVLVTTGYLVLTEMMVGGWERYENSRYNFSFLYPKGFLMNEAPGNNDGRGFLSEDGTIYCHGYGFYNALFNEGGEPQSLDEFVEWLTGIGGVEVIEKEGSSLGGEKGIKVVSLEEGKIKEAVYVLGEESGRGLSCVYDDRGVMEEFRDRFERMRESFYFIGSLDGDEVLTGEDRCSNYLEGVVEPVEDLVSFFDDKYPEVVVTPREYWDDNLLPVKVGEYEGKGYQCYPEPYEFGEKGEGVEREVKSVMWRCEVSYDELRYLEVEKVEEKDRLLVEGYSCEKRECLGESGDDGYIWFCFK